MLYSFAGRFAGIVNLEAVGLRLRDCSVQELWSAPGTLAGRLYHGFQAAIIDGPEATYRIRERARFARRNEYHLVGLAGFYLVALRFAVMDSD